MNFLEIFHWSIFPIVQWYILYWCYLLWSGNTDSMWSTGLWHQDTFQLVAKCCLSRSGVEPQDCHTVTPIASLPNSPTTIPRTSSSLGQIQFGMAQWMETVWTLVNWENEGMWLCGVGGRSTFKECHCGDCTFHHCLMWSEWGCSSRN